MFLEFALEIVPLTTQTTQGTHSSEIPQTQIRGLVQRKHSNILSLSINQRTTIWKIMRKHCSTKRKRRAKIM